MARSEASLRLVSPGTRVTEKAPSSPALPSVPQSVALQTSLQECGRFNPGWGAPCGPWAAGAGRGEPAGESPESRGHLWTVVILVNSWFWVHHRGGSAGPPEDGAPGVLAGSARGSDGPPQAQGHDGFQGSVIFREKVVLCDRKAAAPFGRSFYHDELEVFAVYNKFLANFSNYFAETKVIQPDEPHNQLGRRNHCLTLLLFQLSANLWVKSGNYFECPLVKSREKLQIISPSPMRAVKEAESSPEHPR